jgi:hypothetical protein
MTDQTVDPDDFKVTTTHSVEASVPLPDPVALGVRKVFSRTEGLRSKHGAEYAVLEHLSIDAGQAGYVVSGEVRLLEHV